MNKTAELIRRNGIMALDHIEKHEAEKISGLKLDGRRRYFMWNDEVCFEGKFTHTCSGCDGCGCSECGGHGKRRDSWPIPAKYEHELKDLTK